MSKRMGYSVIGLPHYTIWHLYEPSIDDIKHMEVSMPPSGSRQQTLTRNQEMEKAKLTKDEEEKAKADKAKKIKEDFGDGKEQWEKDKEKMAKGKKEASAKGAPEKSTPGQGTPEKKEEKKTQSGPAQVAPAAPVKPANHAGAKAQ